MNREIKFRGKRLSDGKWVYGNLIVSGKDPALALIEDERMFREMVDPETVGQFTGAKDVAENQIFEDDMLSFGLDTEDMITDWVEYPVFWCGEHFRWEVGGTKQHQGLSSFSFDDEAQGVVVGDIHQDTKGVKGRSQ